MKLFDIAGKVAVVTGGNGGIQTTQIGSGTVATVAGTADSNINSLSVQNGQLWASGVLTNRLAAGYYARHGDGHVTSLIDVYRRKRDALVNGLEAAFAEIPHLKPVWRVPNGGFFRAEFITLR